MKDFGAALHEALQAGEQANIQANIELARTLAQAGSSALDKALELARGAVDLMQEFGRQQIDAIEANAQAGVVASNKVAAAGVVGATAVGVAGVAAEGAFRYGKEKGKQALRDMRQDVGDQLQRQFMPQRAAGNPCLPCLDESSGLARRLRIEKRQRLILHGEQSTDPALREAARQLKDDMHAVELARLSDNSYAQYDPKAGPKQKKPPEPWRAMTEQEIKDAGLTPKLVEDSKAVIYKLPPDFPFDPKVVVAFRGTTLDKEDVLTDHDQALGLETEQYKAARDLGRQLKYRIPGAEVTGHSLGGGKAQAAGVGGDLKGAMFNAAGLHPNSAGMVPSELATHAGRFQQYRAEGAGGGDPLTSVQNSLAQQQKVYGRAQDLQWLARANRWASQELGIQDPLALLPESVQGLARGLVDRILNVTPQEAARNLAFSGGQWYVPPALGQVRGVASKTAQGRNTPLEQQHGIGGVIHGLETRKAGDINRLLAGTGQPGPASDYIGPTQA
jgi:hypothetical protein